MQKKYAKNMQILVDDTNICICPISFPQWHRYAKKIARICKICKHEIYMHNMHLPLC